MAIIIPINPKAHAKARAELKASIAKDMAAQAKQDNSPLQTTQDIKGFWAQYPKTRQLFGVIMTVWRGSSATRPSVPGCWAAHPHAWWRDRSKMPERTLKRHLDLLEEYGLVERQLGKHGGSRVLSFIRPTALALKLSDHRPNDWQHLGQDQYGKPNKPHIAGAKVNAPVQLIATKAPEPEGQPKTFEELMAIFNDED